MSTLKPREKFGTTIFDSETSRQLVRFDANLEEKYSRDAQVPSYPVEGGLPNTENHQANQRRYTLTGEITNTPLQQERDIANRAGFYYRVLDGLVQSGQTLVIATGLEVFENVVLKSYTLPRDFARGQVLDITLEFIQIEITQSETTDVPQAILDQLLRASGKSKRKKNNGPQAETPAESKARKASLLYNLTK